MAVVTMRKNPVSGTRVFRIRCTVDGVTYQRTYPAKNEPRIPETWSNKRAETEARKVAALFENECKNRLVTNDKRIFSEYAKYVIDLKERTEALKPSTIEKYRDLLKRIDEYTLGKTRVRDISVKSLNAFYMDLSGEGQNLNTHGKLSAATIRKFHALVSSVLHQAAREGIISNNPAQNATLPKMEKKEANYYTPEKMAQIIEAVDREPLYWKAMTYIFIGIGARRGEVLGLQWRDIDFENGVISIRRNAYIVNGKIDIKSPKTGEGRKVSIAPDFLSVLKEWRFEQSRIMGGVIRLDGFCFALENMDTPMLPSSVTRYYARLGKRSGLGHLNPHAFRHSQASIILQDGDIATASQRLGHSKASTTLNIYGHMMPQTDREAAEKVSAAFLKVKRG